MLARMVPLQTKIHVPIAIQPAPPANKLDHALHAKQDSSADQNVLILALMALSPKKTRNYVLPAIRLVENALLETYHLAQAAMKDIYFLKLNVFQDALMANI